MIVISNEALRVSVQETGGELQSIKECASGREYLWQGDRAYWGRRALNLFPIVGRLYQKCYLLNGKQYPMALHGFLPHAEMELEESGPNGCCFRLTPTQAMKESYPFDFVFRIRYALKSKTLEIVFEVENHSQDTMYFGMGGHPGFRVPLEEGLCFEDYEVSFPASCEAERVIFTDDVLDSGKRESYPLKDGRSMPLRHDLFSYDAVVFANAPRCATVSSPKGSHGVTVEYPQMPYMGVWQKGNSDAPFICIEPWSSLPGRAGVIEDFAHKADLTALEAGRIFRNAWSITVF